MPISVGSRGQALADQQVVYRRNRLPAKSYPGCLHQRQHRGVHLRKLIMGKPTHVQRLRADIGADQLICEHEILHIEVVRGAYRTARYLVQGEQQRTVIQHEIDESAFFMCLPLGRGLQARIGWLDVTAGLQPPADARVQRQQHPAFRRRTDQRARSQVSPKAGPRPAVGPLRKMIKKILS